MLYPARTAIKRRKASRPAEFFAWEGPVGRAKLWSSVLDWGCGHGTDVDWFNELGMDARGYDPHLRPRVSYKNTRPKFDYVTCFYVLCVIPTKKERVAVIKEASAYLAKGGKMFIAVRPRSKVEYEAKKWKKFRDGYKTSRDTFQRGFTSDELKALVKAAGLCYSPWNKSGFVGCVVTKP